MSVTCNGNPADRGARPVCSLLWRLLAGSVVPLWLIACTACATSAAPSPQTVALGAEFSLSPSGKARLEDSDFEVQFLSIAEDSRCPKDATCVWAGQVKVRLGIVVGQRSAALHEVLEQESVTVDRYRIKVVRVLPYPTMSVKIAPSEYRVTLIVEQVP